MKTPADLLDVESIDVDLFIARAVPPAADAPPRWRLFGGQVAGQSLRAALETVEADRPVHSLHCYFLRPGNPALDLLFYVDRSRDGGSFTTRHVRARQGGETIFELIASFHAPEPSEERMLPAPDVPSVSDVAHGLSTVPPRPWDQEEWFDAYAVPVDEAPRAQIDESVLRFWIRTNERLPDVPGVHAALLTYISDMRTGNAALHSVGKEGPSPDMGVQLASLDHAMWFHRPMRADDWVLMEILSTSVSGSRVHMRGTLHDAYGLHGASFAQELLMRPLRPGG
jgi:acyl-CoA thioesterase-2